MGKVRFNKLPIEGLKSDLKYYGFVEQVQYFNDTERELFHHCVWFNENKHTGLVITRRMFDSDKNLFNVFEDSSIETFVKNIIENQDFSIEKVFNDKVKKNSEIYGFVEPDTLKSVLETENTLVSIVYSVNSGFSTQVDYSLGLFYKEEPFCNNEYIRMNGIEVEKILNAVLSYNQK